MQHFSVQVVLPSVLFGYGRCVKSSFNERVIAEKNLNNEALEVSVRDRIFQRRGMGGIETDRVRGHKKWCSFRAPTIYSGDKPPNYVDQHFQKLVWQKGSQFLHTYCRGGKMKKINRREQSLGQEEFGAFAFHSS